MDSYTMEHYSAVKEDEIMKFSCKYMEREKIILIEAIQNQRDKYDMY